MVKIKLIKGRSYLGETKDGTIKATLKKPVVSVSEEEAKRLISTGYFALTKDADDKSGNNGEENGGESTGDNNKDGELFEGEIDSETLEAMNINELRAFASEHGIDLSGKSRKAEILEAISVALGGSLTMLDIQE
ncbi:MAG: Rho termination factor N-terminal domain-containing protein [Oscillospiraceae bacterium]|nr:Rho termination factor N-terminal domain-containing protein [Oscillospiraceae bacterium]